MSRAGAGVYRGSMSPSAAQRIRRFKTLSATKLPPAGEAVFPNLFGALRTLVTGKGVPYISAYETMCKNRTCAKFDGDYIPFELISAISTPKVQL